MISRKVLVFPIHRLRFPVTKLGHFYLGKGQVSREREPTNLLPLHCLLKADNYLNMPASFLPSRAFTSVIQQHVCEWKTSTALGTWGQQSCFPTPLLPVGTAAGQNGCQGAGAVGWGWERAGWIMRSQKPMGGRPGSQQADNASCRMEVRGRLKQQQQHHG